MIKDNQRYFNRLHVVIDVIGIVISYFLAWVVRFKIFGVDEGTGVLPASTYFRALLYIVPVYLILYYISHLYQSKRYSSRKKEFFNILKANTFGMIFLLGVLYLSDQRDFSSGMILIFYFINICSAVLIRNIIRYSLRFARKKGYNTKHIVLVGYSRAAEEYINKILANPQWGYKLHGVLDNNLPVGTVYRGVSVNGRIEDLGDLLEQENPDEIAITLALEDYNRLEEIVNICEKSGVHTKFIPDYNSVIPSKPYTEDLMGLPVINIRRVPLTNTLNLLMKRTVDIVGSLFALVLFSPIMLIIVIGIKLSDKGPVIFKQERIGLHNKQFQMYKFRTMRIQSSGEEKLGWTVKGDPRITGIGKLLRKTSLDELPQFINILKGDMSLVGPRPERPMFVERFKEEIPRYMVKHQVRPGLTGWAQVNGYRGDTSIRKRIEYDLFYIENWTPWLDIKILLLTFFKGFINKNAY